MNNKWACVINYPFLSDVVKSRFNVYAITLVIKMMM